MMTLPDFTTPEALAEKLGWSARRVRDVARTLGACRIMGNRMVLLNEDVQAILEVAGTPGLLVETKKIELKSPVGGGVIYFLECRGAVKIGWTKNIKRRMIAIQTDAPGKLVLLGKIRGSIKDERALHAKFKAHHLHGEWFDLTDEIKEYIGGLK